MSYRIFDEPRPSQLSHLAVNPIWPLLGVMFGGAWLSWPWFAVNAYAVGSPTRRRELMLALIGFPGTFAVLMGIGWLAQLVGIDSPQSRYLGVALSVWKLAVSYWLYVMQARSFGLWEHYGGAARSGMLVIAAAFFLRRPILEAVPQLWQIVLG